MTRSEIALLLGYIAARDRRTVGETDVLAWHEDLGDLDAQDARMAVGRHFRESTEYLMPAHVRRIVRIIRDEHRKGEVIKTLPPNRFTLTAAPEPTSKGADRVREILAEIAAKKAVPEPETNARPPTRSETVHARALARARAENRSTRS